MEIRARYVLIGAFTVAVIAAGFVFVYWLNNAGGLSQRDVYRIRYEKTVSGLLKGSAVLFNGIRVGEVGRLDIDPADPRRIIVSIAVERRTPVRADTKAGIEFQGLTGAPVVSLLGGTAMAPALAATAGEPPLLIADTGANQHLTEAAREALRNINALVTDNAEPLRSLIANLNTFSAALARNSDRVDGIVGGLDRLTGGGAKAAAQILELASVRSIPAVAKLPAGQLIIPEPSALSIFDTEKILLKGISGPKPGADGAQWPDTLPKVVQSRIIQGFETAGFTRVVGRAPEGMSAEHQLLIDIRSFHMTPAPAITAEVALSAKLVRNDGRIAAARVFRATAPPAAADAPGAATALGDAFAMAVQELVPWALAAM